MAGSDPFAAQDLIDWSVPWHEPAEPQAGPVPASEPVPSAVPGQEHRVFLGADQVRITLAADPAPDLAWAPLPYDTPDGGIAFACLGTGDRGCLFLDLGQAPGAITIAGDREAAERLAESIAHQLCTAAEKSSCAVMVVGDALPQPHPLGATWVASLDRLGPALAAQPGEVTTVVFCDAGALALGDEVSAAPCRVVPVLVNAPFPAPWSLTVTPEADPGPAARQGPRPVPPSWN